MHWLGHLAVLLLAVSRRNEEGRRVTSPAVAAFGPPTSCAPKTSRRHLMTPFSASRSSPIVGTTTTTHSATASANNDSQTDRKTTVSPTTTISLPKPMGLLLEESSESAGCFLVGLQGNALEASKQDKNWDVCIKDELIAIQGRDCQDWTLEQVMEAVIDDPGPVISMSFRRPAGTVKVRFVRSRVNVAASPGEHICNLAFDHKTPIEYSCRNGSCGTCEQLMVCDGEKKRYVRPCVATVPRNCNEVLIVPSDRYYEDLSP